jgi:hypothetical protein
MYAEKWRGGLTMTESNGSTQGVNGEVRANGHAHTVPPEIVIQPLQPQLVTLLDELQVPFDASLVKWRSNETKTIQRQLQGLCLPYADPRAYKDRLNSLVSPIGWRDKYAITTTPTKILVTCELTVDHLGCHSATGEEWSRNENAATAAEAQAFKRSCAGFGLGRYFYHFDGLWLALDPQKRPKAKPQLPEWATPEGWRRGLRPPAKTTSEREPEKTELEGSSGRELVHSPKRAGKNVIQELRGMQSLIGAGLYRGLLKSLARVWNPAQIRDISLQHQVLRHMEAAHRGILRVEAALRLLDESAAREIFRSLDLNSFREVRDLHTLQQLFSALEKAAGTIS